MDSGLLVLVLALIILIALVLALRTLGKRERVSGGDAAPPLFPYKRRETLLSPGERSFYHALREAAGSLSMDVFAKVRLEDFIEVDRRAAGSAVQSYRNRIKSRHVDFLLCDRERYGPVLAVELDDASHSRADRQERDEFVNKALDATGLPLQRVSARGSHSVQQLAHLISHTLGRSNET